MNSDNALKERKEKLKFQVKEYFKNYMDFYNNIQKEENFTIDEYIDQIEEFLDQPIDNIKNPVRKFSIALTGIIKRDLFENNWLEGNHAQECMVYHLIEVDTLYSMLKDLIILYGDDNDV